MSDNRSVPVSIYVDRLTMLAALRIAAFLWRHRGPARVVFLEKARLHNRIAQFIGRILAIDEFEHCPLGPADLTDAEGDNLFFWKDAALHRISERLLSRADMQAVASEFASDCNAEHWRMDIKRRLNKSLYVEFGRYCVMVRHAELNHRDKAIFVFDQSPFVKDIVTELACHKVILSPAWRRMQGIAREVAGAIRQTFLPLRSGALPKSIPVTVAVQYSLGLPENDRSDLGWIEGTNINREQVLLYLDGSHSGRSHSVLQEAARYGVRVVDFGQWRPHRSDLNYRRDLRRMWRAAARLAFRAGALPLRGRLWLLQGFLSHARARARWRSFFEEMDVKLLVHVGDSEDDLLARTAAVEMRGGIDMSFQFSGMGWNLPMNSRPVNQHQFFTWGTANADMIRHCDQVCPVKVPNVFFLGGNPYQHIAKFNQAEIEEAVRGVRKAGGRFVILALDSACGRDVAPTTNAIVNFYQVVLDIVQRHPDLGLLIKSQSAVYENAMNPQLAPVVQALVETGRVRPLPSRLRPFQVFPHIDLAVGVGSGNTAVIEAASAECPHIYYDNYAWTRHIVYEKAPLPLVVSTPHHLEAAIMTHRDGMALGPSDLGYRAYLDWLDPFRDQKGHRRLGWLISIVASSIAKCGSAAKAMPEIVEAYRTEIGGDWAVLPIKWPYDDCLERRTSAPEHSAASTGDVLAKDIGAI